MLEAIIRILLTVVLLGGIHAYLWLRLVRPTPLSRRWYLAVTAGLFLMSLSIPVTIASRMPAPGLAATLGWISLPWMALAGLVFVALVAIDGVRLLGRLVELVANGRRARARTATRSPRPPSLSRRQFLTRAIAGAALTLGGGSVVTGMAKPLGDH